MDKITHGVLRFDRFTLDQTRGCLRDGDLDVDLAPKPFEVLCYLVTNAGRLVSKTELFEAVWPGVVVSDDSLVQCIRELRRRLGDEEHRLIKTVSRRGYRIEATVVPWSLAELAGPQPQRAGEIATDWALHHVDRGQQPQQAVETDTQVAALDRQLSLIVLPFQNVGGGPEQEYLVNGDAP